MTQKKSDLVLAKSGQASLFHVEKQAEVNGIEMGVLENGAPYLSESGLARMCGVDQKVLNRLSAGWDEEKTKPRGRQIAELLDQAGYNEPSLYLRSELNGKPINAYTEAVCLAILEYYAFLAEEKREEAMRAFRALARFTFREFIYQAVGYAPRHRGITSWQHYHDRTSLTKDSAPKGYFIVFREIGTIIIPMIEAGVMVSDKVLPDISVGISWAGFWDANKLEEKYGPSIRCEHEYPDYYPQSKSNPQKPRAYPNAALGEFRSWLEDNYLAQQFPRYITRQAVRGKVSKLTAAGAISALSPKALPKK